MDAADVLGHSYNLPQTHRLMRQNQAALHCHCPHGSVGTRSTLLMCGLHNATPLPVGLFCLSVPGESDFCSALCRRNSLTLAETLHAQPEDLLLLICCECGESVWCEHEEESLGGEAPMCE
ncbi:uncharacterized protein LOC102081091 [Oreochromis niloticus]|uniref:uncharacterized protein LOC102081091 n=1 Tax=Oreochromis niloticus TaxID=8128 RepID=UPI000DF22074|nr:uncharacterized protein LOC102081091 [Oreochromis niloticus]